MLTDLEAYLLSKMRAIDQIARVVRAEGISPKDLAKKAYRAASVWGLDQSIHNADVYREAIGAPVSEQLLTGDNTVPVFIGSVCRLYRLPLWPRVLFRVNQHPSGYAWDVAFVQSISADTLPEPSAIEPWEWVAATIESAASRVEVLDAWDHQKDLRVVFFREGSRLVYIAKFDFDLLQEWRQVSEE